jgi:hypothetical protein
MPHPATHKTYGSRAELHSNPTAKRLLEIMQRKKSNLCVSVDVTTTAEVLEIVRRVGPSVCMVKVGRDRSTYLHIASSEDCLVGGCGRSIFGSSRRHTATSSTTSRWRSPTSS